MTIQPIYRRGACVRSGTSGRAVSCWPQEECTSMRTTLFPRSSSQSATSAIQRRCSRMTMRALRTFDCPSANHCRSISHEPTILSYFDPPRHFCSNKCINDLIVITARINHIILAIAGVIIPPLPLSFLPLPRLFLPPSSWAMFARESVYLCFSGDAWVRETEGWREGGWKGGRREERPHQSCDSCGQHASICFKHDGRCC